MEYTITKKPDILRELRVLPQYKELFMALAWRVIKLHYKNKWIGISWTTIHPLLVTGMFFIVFDSKMGGDFSNYFLFIFSGLMLWDVFAGSLTISSNSFVENGYMIKKIYFPRFILPLTYIAAKLVDFCIALIVLLILMTISISIENWFAFFGFTLLALFNTVLVTSGICLAFSTLMVQFRNLQSLLPFVIHVLFFSSSVMYDPKLLINIEWINRLFQLNPMTGTLYMFRLGIFNNNAQWDLLSFYILWSVFIFLAGFAVFMFKNKTIPDNL